jgi:hypothetical protein
VPKGPNPEVKQIVKDLTEIARANDVSLEDCLRKIATHYDGSNTEDDRRDACFQALMKVTSDLQRRGMPERNLRPLTALIHALHDWDKGIDSPLFRRQRKGGGPPIRFQEQRQRGLAAAAVTLFSQEHGKSEKQALQEVVDRIKKWPAAKNRRSRNQDKRQSLLEAVRDWRNKAMSGSRKEDVDAEIYFEMLEHAERDEEAPSPSYWAELALAAGDDLYR